MYKTLKISFTLLLITLAAAVALVVYQAINVSPVAAHDGEEENSQQEESSEDANAQGPSYTYTAQPGDSYTELARKAIQTYGIDNNVNLTPAGIIFAETSLTQEAGGEALNEGQEVSIDSELVKKWVEAAEKLSEAEQQDWNVYVPFVNFNTDKVGQSN